jgi:uncharacterized protein (TIGR00725 family)
MRYQICVSGSARGEAVERDATLAYEVGKAIARSDATLLSGATVGIPDHAARGCHAAGGQSIGISPAATRLEHIRKYNLPTASYDFILYTGLHYIGRDALLISSADAIITIGGRIGTTHEFAIALELGKPIGIMARSGGTSELFEDILRAAGIRDLESHHVIIETNPIKMVKRLIKIIRETAEEESTGVELSQRQ